MIARITYSVLRDLVKDLNLDTNKMCLTSAVEGGSVRECPFLISVMQDDFAECVRLFGNNKNAVGFSIADTVDFAKTIEGIKAVTLIRDLNVIAQYAFKSEQDDALNSTLQWFKDIVATVPEYRMINVLIKLPNDFTNMEYVKDMCVKYPNVRFTGGNLLALCDTRIGAVENIDLPKKIADSKLPLIYSGEQSVDLVVDYMDMFNIEWSNKGKTVKSTINTTYQSTKENTNNGVVTSIESTVTEKGVDADNVAVKTEKKSKDVKTSKVVKPTKKTIIANKFGAVDDDEF